MTLPRITLITPSYNQGKFIRETIESVLAQGYPNLQYIIIDGGSNDETVSILESFDKQISYWSSLKDNGQAHAINKGIALADGNIISWLNSDDLLADGALMAIGNAFAADPSLTCVTGKIEMFNTKGVFRKTTNIVSSTLPETIGYGKVAQPAMYFKKETYIKTGLLNEHLHFMMDTEWYIRYLFLYGQESILEIDPVIALFRMHEESKTVSLAEKFRYERDSLYYSLARIYNRNVQADFIKFYAKVDEAIKITGCSGGEAIIDKVLNYFIFQLGQEYYNYKVREKCIACFDFIQMNLLNPFDQQTAIKLKNRIRFIPAFIWKILNKKA